MNCKSCNFPIEEKGYNCPECGEFNLNIGVKYSSLVKKSKPSFIREILKLSGSSDLISFAGGVPSPETFAVGDIKNTMMELMETDGKSALQYGITEGDVAL